MSEIINSTDADFEELIEKNENVIIKYYADWCGSCKLMAPKYKRLSEDDANEGITFLEVNAEQNDLARQMSGVNNLPFFATYKNGELVDADATSKIETAEEMIKKLKKQKK